MALHMDKAIDNVIYFIVIVALVPGALVSYFNVSTATWDASTIAIWGVLALLFIVALMKGFRGGKGR